MASRVPTFKEFWQAYPLHRDRLRAEKAWNRMAAADKAAAIAALPDYTSDCLQRGVAFQYAQGWLNGRRWEDEMEPPQERQVSSVKRQVSGDSGTEREHSAENEPETCNLKPETSGNAEPSLADMETW